VIILYIRSTRSPNLHTMEMALIPGMLWMGECIAGEIGTAVAEYHLTARGSNSGSDTVRSHPGIYSARNDNKTHSGIYCNPALQQQNLAPVAESQAYPLEKSGACSTLPSRQPSAKNSASKYLLSFDSDGMVSQAHEPEDATASKISGGLGFLPLTRKNISTASNSTASTCSDLDTSDTFSISSLNMSNTSEQQSPESICEEDRKGQSIGANLINQSQASSAKAPVCKTRSVFSDLDNLTKDLDNLTKDLGMLKTTKVSSKRSR